jgi:hypothetical protein
MAGTIVVAAATPVLEIVVRAAAYEARPAYEVMR